MEAVQQTRTRPGRQRRGGRPPKTAHLSEALTIRFEPEMLAQLRELAKQQGMAPATLIRMWTLERLQTQPMPEAKRTKGALLRFAP